MNAPLLPSDMGEIPNRFNINNNAHMISVMIARIMAIIEHELNNESAIIKPIFFEFLGIKGNRSVICVFFSGWRWRCFCSAQPNTAIIGQGSKKFCQDRLLRASVSADVFVVKLDSKPDRPIKINSIANCNIAVDMN